MAKSLRSKSKLQAKSIKRKGEFAKYADERSRRIAERLAKETAKQEAEKKSKQENGQETMDLDEEDKGDTDGKSKKVSTSGWRDSNSQRYKQRQLKNKSKKKTLKF